MGSDMDNQIEQSMGPWNELKIKALHYWSKLSEDDFKNFAGGLEEMKKKIKTIYGYSSQQLESEFAHFLKTVNRESRPKRQPSH
jgi:hypothetical protein